MATAIVKKCKRRGNMSISQYVREILDYISAPTTNKSPDDNSQSSPEGPWLSLAEAQTILHGIARNTLMIADMADRAAERRKAERICQR